MVRMIENGSIKFDNIVQRGFVWDIRRKSLLISSILENYPIPEIYAAKNGKAYDIFDGNQRCNSIKEFVLGKYRLKGLSPIKTEKGTEDINGKKFNELTEQMQDTINSYMLNILYFDNITENEISEIFFRINNGKPLSTIELNRAKAISLDKIQSLGQHELFIRILTKKAFQKKINEDLVIRTWGTIFIKDISFRRSDIRTILNTTEITDEQIEILDEVFTRIFTIYQFIRNIGGDLNQRKKYKKLLSNIMIPTHFNILSYVVYLSIQDNISITELTEWTTSFFSIEDDITTSKEYNFLVGTGASNPENIKKRLNIAVNSYSKLYSVKDVKIKTIKKTVKNGG